MANFTNGTGSTGDIVAELKASAECCGQKYKFLTDGLDTKTANYGAAVTAAQAMNTADNARIIHTTHDNLQTQLDLATMQINMQSSINADSWEQRLLLPGLEMASQLLLLEWQKDQFEELKEERLGYIQCATTQWIERMDYLRDYLSEIIDDIPQQAMYQPVSFAGEQLETVTDNMQALKYNAQYVEQVNRHHVEHDLARQALLNPKYYEQTECSATSIGDLMKGRLPIDDVVEILSDTAQQALLTGKIGNSCKLTLRNLGISTLRAQTAGRQEAREERRSVNETSPIQRMADVRSLEVTPADRVSIAITQAQLMQNSLQSAYDTCSKKAPYLWHQLQMDIKKAEMEVMNQAQKAGMTTAFVPNYAQLFSQQLGDLFQQQTGQSQPSTSVVDSYEGPTWKKAPIRATPVLTK